MPSVQKCMLIENCPMYRSTGLRSAASVRYRTSWHPRSPMLPIGRPVFPSGISALNSGHTFPTAPITPVPIQKLCNKQVQ